MPYKLLQRLAGSESGLPRWLQDGLSPRAFAVLHHLWQGAEAMMLLLLWAALATCCSAGRLPEHRLHLHSIPEPSSISSLSVKEQSISSAPGSAKPPSSSSSIIPVFADLGNSYEPHWIHEVVLSGVREECGAALKLERREDLAALFPTHGGVIVATGGLSPGEEQLLRELPSQQTQRVVLLHLSDESNSHDTAIYERFGAVYRNYYRASVNQSMSYLTSEEGSPEPSHARELRSPLGSDGVSDEPSHARELKAGSSADVFWMPLGYGMRLLNNPSLMTPASSRPLLFSWSGSTSGKEDRTKMLQALKEATDVLERGFIDKFDNFNAGGKDTPSSYTAMLYNSSIIPCPRGIHAEQFRIWEALEVGALPVVLDEEQHDHLERIGLRLPKVKSWAALPEFLKEWGQPEMAWKLDALSAELHDSWQLIKSRLRKHVGKTICAFATGD